MTAIRRLTDSPGYKTRWRRRINPVAVAGAGIAVLMSVPFLEDVFAEHARWWAVPLSMGLIASLTSMAIKKIAELSGPIADDPRPQFRDVEDRLDELERLKRREMVTPEEYAAKRVEILKDL